MFFGEEGRQLFFSFFWGGRLLMFWWKVLQLYVLLPLLVQIRFLTVVVGYNDMFNKSCDFSEKLSVIPNIFVVFSVDAC